VRVAVAFQHDVKGVVLLADAATAAVEAGGDFVTPDDFSTALAGTAAVGVRGNVDQINLQCGAGLQLIVGGNHHALFRAVDQQAKVFLTLPFEYTDVAFQNPAWVHALFVVRVRTH